MQTENHRSTAGCAMPIRRCSEMRAQTSAVPFPLSLAFFDLIYAIANRLLVKQEYSSFIKIK
jgi:hypothetical protein